MSSYTKWNPFGFACRWRCLRQGALNVGNTAQNVASLKAAAVTEANGAAVWAKYDAVSKKLKILPASVPGFVKPVHS